MKKNTTKKPKVSPKKKVVKVRSRIAHTPKRLTSKQHMAVLGGIGKIIAKGVAKKEPGRFVVTVPTPPAAPTYSAPWRAGIDWAAAGRKAYETKMRNLALKAGAKPLPDRTMGKPVDPNSYVMAKDDPAMQRRRQRKAPAAPSVALKEEDTSRS